MLSFYYVHERLLSVYTNDNPSEEAVSLCLIEIFTNHYEEFRNKATADLHTTADAEDAIQNAFLKAWKYRNKLRNLESAYPWVNRILFNECIAVARKRLRIVAVPLDPQMYESMPSVDFSGASTEKRIMDTILTKLDAKHRVPAFLHFLGGYSAKEIAQNLNMDEALIKHRITYAKKLIQQHFE